MKIDFKKIDKKEVILLLGLILLAAFFRFYHLDRADITNDAAMYSFRSIGYLDYTVSDIQTTPLDWFGHFHWWSKLSFHDAPPLVFLVQHLFFALFGVNLIIARLPFIIFGVLTVLFFYFLVKDLYGRNLAILASVFLSLDAYHTLASQSGLLEPILLFFIILSLWFFNKGFKTSVYFIFSYIFFALALLSKYFALSLVPVFLFLLIFNKERKKIIRDWKFYLAIIMFIVAISPLIIYNFKMLRTRGHFDMQLAFLSGQEQNDWRSINERLVGAGIANSFFGFFESIKNSSIVVYYLFLLSSFWLTIRLFFYRQKKYLFIFLILASFLFFFSLIGSSARYLAILPPFIYLAICLSAFDLIEKVTRLKYLIFAFLGILLVYLALFNLNSNQIMPWGSANFAYSAYREDNWGYNQLESYWTSKYQGVYQLRPAKIDKLEDVYLANNLQEIPAMLKDSLLVYDSKINWFAKEWYFYRWIIYYRIPFVSTDEFAQIAKDERGLNLINALSSKNLLFIKATDKTLLDQGEANVSTSAELIEKKLNEQQINPIDIVKNPRGEEVFRIYQIPHLIKK